MLRSTIGINLDEANAMLLLLGQKDQTPSNLILPGVEILAIRRRMIAKLERAVATMNRHREK